MSRGRGHVQQRQLPEPRRSQSIRLVASDHLAISLIPPVFTLACSFGNFHELNHGGSYHELVTGTMEAAICYPYMFVKLYESATSLLPARGLPPLIDLITWPSGVRVFRDAAVLVVIAYVVLLDISLSFLWLGVFPVMAVVFICAVYFKLYRGGGRGDGDAPGSSNNVVDERTVKTPVELEVMAVVTFAALLVMDQLDDDAAEGFAVSQFLLFLSSAVAALTRMMMKLPADASPGIAPASELLYKTLLLLLLVTAHTVVAEWLGEDAILVCAPEVVPVLLWSTLHLDHAAGSSSSAIVDKMKPHSNSWLTAAIGAAAVAPLLAYLASSMDASVLSRCTAIMVSCGVSGALTYYLFFMQRQWPRPQAADAAGGGMLQLWAYALLVAAGALLLLTSLVSLRQGSTTYFFL